MMTANLRFNVSMVSAIFGMMLAGSPCEADHSDRLNELLSAGHLETAKTEFQQIVEDRPDDQQARLAVGLAHFLEAIQGLATAQYRYGLMNQYADFPIVRMPVPRNPTPARISHNDFRRLLEEFSEHLRQAEQALAQVNTQDVKLSLRVGRIRFDIDGDGAAGKSESLWKMFTAVNRGVRPELAEGFSIGFDGADVHWLRGYCHVLMAFCDMALAYDGRVWFESCGHLLYPDVDTPYEFLRREHVTDAYDSRRLADVIAAIHLLNFPLKDADRLRSAHQHLLSMVDQSRRCWERALAETDDDREWIPNPQQQGVIGLRVAREQVDGWHEVLDEFEAVLKGEKLIPFWRKYGRLPIFFAPLPSPDAVPEEGTGINVRRFFTEPRDLDVVLFLTGTGATPYLEEGPLSTPAAWQRITRVFQGEFFGFAIWFN